MMSSNLLKAMVEARVLQRLYYKDVGVMETSTIVLSRRTKR